MDYQTNYKSSQTKIFLDIETIPAGDNLKEVAISSAIKKAAKYNKEAVTQTKDSFFRQTAISGDFGQIFCIGYAVNDKQVDIIKGNEKEILTAWWQIADKADLFIGHNVIDFDLRFIFKRSIVHKIRPTAKHSNLSFARYRNFPIYDTMREWEKWSQSYISLDNLAKALSLESSKSDGIEGSKVYDFYLKGEHQKIYEYCKRDVELTRRIYKRLTFQE